MRILQQRIVFLAACVVFVFGAVVRMGFAAQAKSASEQKAGATVDLNTASEKDLDSLPGVGPATAKKIIAGRPYSSVDGLSKAGVSSATIKKITPLVTASGGTTPATSPEPNMKSNTKTSAKDVAPASQPEPSPATSRQPASAPPKSSASTTSQTTSGPGTVWVNLDSGVYHYSGTRYYGKTKNGKYMSEADAVTAGYRPAKNEKKPK